MHRIDAALPAAEEKYEDHCVVPALFSFWRKPACVPPRTACRGLSVGKLVEVVCPPTKMSPVVLSCTMMVGWSVAPPP